MIKFNKKLALSTILIFALIIAGCGTYGNGSSSGSFSPFGSSPSKKIPELNVFVGTQGLTSEFVKNAPPQKVFESSSFPILLRIRNIGSFSIDGKNQLSKYGTYLSIGRERDYIPELKIEEQNRMKTYDSIESDNLAQFFIDGKTQTNPKGEEITVPVNAQTGKLDPQSENKQSTMTATLCYPYKTTLSTTVCIDPDIAGVRPGKKVCDVKILSFGGGQGAPVAVKIIEPQMIPEADKDIIKPQFLIFVENVGRGNPVNINNYNNACNNMDFNDPKKKDEIRNIWNVAFLRAYSSGKEGENQLICCPNINGECDEKESNTDKIAGFIRFHDKKDYARCIFKNGVPRNSDAFTSPLRVEIDYGYVQTISANFFIQKPVKY